MGPGLSGEWCQDWVTIWHERKATRSGVGLFVTQTASGSLAGRGEGAPASGGASKVAGLSHQPSHHTDAQRGPLSYPSQESQALGSHTRGSCWCPVRWGPSRPTKTTQCRGSSEARLQHSRLIDRIRLLHRPTHLSETHIPQIPSALGGAFTTFNEPCRLHELLTSHTPFGGSGVPPLRTPGSRSRACSMTPLK